MVLVRFGGPKESAWNDTRGHGWGIFNPRKQRNVDYAGKVSKAKSWKNYSMPVDTYNKTRFRARIQTHLFISAGA